MLLILSALPGALVAAFSPRSGAGFTGMVAGVLVLLLLGLGISYLLFRQNICEERVLETMTNLLIVEDDRSLNNGIQLALKQQDCIFYQAYNCREAREYLKTREIHLVILDINLPDGSGYEILQELRRRSDLPVLMLTANDMEMDEVMGLELGADDYMTKPFSLAVLRARIHNLLRRKQPKQAVYERDSLFFDFENMVFQKAGQELNLSRTEQKLLSLLVRNGGQTLPRERLVDHLWTDGAEYVDENALSVSIRRLREKIEEDPSHPQYIQTVYGIGYVWKDGRQN